MSDSIPSQSGDDAMAPSAAASLAAPAPAAVIASAGALLRQGRLAAGLHIAALAVSLKVPVRRLEALEGDRFDLLPDAVFVRALASSVCRALKMDAAPVLALLPASAPPRLSAATERVNDLYTSGHSGRGLPVWSTVSKPVVGAAAALLVATLGLVVWPLVRTTSTDTAVNALAVSAPSLEDAAKVSDSAAPMPTASVAPDVNVVTTVVQPVALPAQAPAPVAPAVLATTAPAAVVTSTAAVATVKPVAIPAPAAANASVPVTPASSGTGIVVFRPSAPSWVEVTDAKSTVVLRRMLAAGEVTGASGALPLSVVIGRADVTQVQVRGQAFDLTSIARENVARFEVK